MLTSSLRISERVFIEVYVVQGVKIAVLDDHRMFLDGLALMVEGAANNYTVDNFSEPLSLLKELEVGRQWDLIICDLIMNQMNGLAFIAAVRTHDKKTPVLVLSGINTSPPLSEMKQLGANGFVHKSSDNDVLLSAIETILSGASYFQPEHPELPEPLNVGLDVNERPSGIPDAQVLPVLGARQLEVLQMIAQGASNKEVSRLLSISENTVKTHLRQIFLELGVNKRTACIRRAQSFGII